MKKIYKQILFGIVGLAVFFIAINIASDSLAPVGVVEGATLLVSETTWDFKEIPMSEGIVTHEVQLTNNSNQPITLTRMETSCMCTTAQLEHSDGRKSREKGMAGHGGSTALSETIDPQETATLLVRFDPNAHGPDATGPISRDVFIETNSQDQPVIELTFSGNVIK